MSWRIVKTFPLLIQSSAPFCIANSNKIFTCVYDLYGGGIYSYNASTDTDKAVKLWEDLNCSFQKQYTDAVIYNEVENKIIFVGESLTIYDMKNCTIQTLDLKSKIGVNTSLALTCNDRYLHIIGGSENHHHILYNLKNNKQHIVHTFKDNICGHAIMYNHSTNTMIMIGGKSSTTNVLFDDFWTMDFNQSNYAWTLNKKQKLPAKMSHFGYVLYDNRVIIIFGGGTSVYYMDLLGKKTWKKSKIKCPQSRRCHALIMNNKSVHIAYCYGKSADRFCIDIAEILPAKLVNINKNNIMKNENEANNIIAAVECNGCEILEKETNELRQQKEALILLMKQTNMKSTNNEMNKESELFISKNNVLKQQISDNKQVIVNANSERDKFKRQIRELNDKSEQIEEINKNNINDLMKENVTLTQQINEMKQNDKRLQSEIVLLKNKLNLLETEQKELVMENQQLKHEINHLKVEQESINIDITKYLDWGPHEIVTWIVSLDTNRYLKYHETLKEALENEGVTGKHLSEVNEADIKGWGVVNFDDKKDLSVQIKQLVNK